MPADGWSSTHERARTLAAERIDWPLPVDDEAWLDGHLAGCERCSVVADQYGASHVAFRTLRGAAPEPPRDLWARTSAGIERESARRHGARRSTNGQRSGRPSPVVPLGALSGVLVVVVLLGVSVLSGPAVPLPADMPTGVESAPSADDQALRSGPTRGPAATPLVVGAGSVEWLRLAGGSRYDYTIARVDEVCSASGRPDCATIPDGTVRQSLDLLAAPKTIIGSPTNGEAVVVGETDENGNELFLVELPAPNTGSVGPESSPVPSETARSSPAAASVEPAPTEGPTPSANAEATRSPQPMPSASITSSPEPTAVATDTPPLTNSPDPRVGPTPELSPTPTTAARLAIASDVTVVGQTAAFSQDGTWFAFTARPSDGSRGPDIYAWHRGDEKVRPLTSDHRSVFASWLGDSILGSRPEPPIEDGQNDGVVAPTTFLVDPATGAENALPDAGWRPVVDPTERHVIAWRGTVTSTESGLDWSPAVGALELRPWSPSVPTDPAGEQLSTGPVTDFDVRWDESGDWVAVWIADGADPTIGRLTLYRVDPETGAVARPDNGPEGVAALPGFSIGDGRLAWATPQGQGGEGSKVRIVAWSNEGVGQVESAPGEDVVVVR
jgi:hypothetical protein